MEPTLFEGDYIIVSKFAYGWSKHSIPFSPPVLSGRLFERQPHRGDVVVFKTPHDNRTDFIKRLIGLPGDRIQVTRGVLYLNGKAVQRVAAGTGEATCPGYSLEPNAGVAQFRETLPSGKSYKTDDCIPDAGTVDNTGVYVVPPGNYFMMGDNRDNSMDSRFSLEDNGVGFVPAENLVGKADFILFSWNRGASLFKPWTWFTHARLSRFFHTLQ
jgi:signal peptidase I